MKILDNNALNHVVRNKIRLGEIYFVTPDVREEFEAGFDQALPTNVRDVGEEAWFDGSEYLRNYQTILNRPTGRSFSSMSGFGDVSILALLLTQKTAAVGTLPGTAEEHLVVSGDVGLIKRVGDEFADKTNEFNSKVSIISHETYRW